jgi:hypothetical protein
MVGLEGFEPPTHGLGILWPDVPASNINDLQMSRAMKTAAKLPE